MKAECRVRNAKCGNARMRFLSILMSFRSAFRPPHFAFTLLETMLAVAIIALIGTAIYRFTSTTLLIARIGSGEAARAQACAGFHRLLQAQFDALPAQELDALAGVEKARAPDGNGDQLRLICSAGNGLLSRFGPASSFVTLKLGTDASPTQLGLSRTLREDSEGGYKQDFGWVPLLDNVSDLKITYYSARLNGWLPRWNDANSLPELVRVRLSFADGQGDYEVTLRVPVRGRSVVSVPVLPNDPRRPGVVSPIGSPPGTAGQPASAPPTNVPPPPPPMTSVPQLPPGLTPPALPPVLRPGGR